ncbi:MAG: acetyl-coenzyme A synthetase N-terminal domain-containing protein, partial [Pseudomonadota bacterium]
MTSYKDVYEGWKADPEAFWMEAAKAIDWDVPPTKALEDADAPIYRWFADAKMN